MPGQDTLEVICPLDLRSEMPVNMAVQEPWARVVGDETERYIVAGSTDTDDVAPRRVLVVVLLAARDANDVEVVPVQMHGVLRFPSRYRHYHHRSPGR